LCCCCQLGSVCATPFQGGLGVFRSFSDVTRSAAQQEAQRKQSVDNYVFIALDGQQCQNLIDFGAVLNEQVGNRRRRHELVTERRHACAVVIVGRDCLTFLGMRRKLWFIFFLIKIYTNKLNIN